MNHLQSPAVLTDNQGTPIVPTVIPPVTEFPSKKVRDQSHPTQGAFQSEAQPRTSADTADTEGSYFDQSHALDPQQPLDPDIATEDHATTPANRAQNQGAGTSSVRTRPNIAQGWQTDKPAAAPRRSTFTRGMFRRATAGQQPQKRRAPDSYQFQDVSSDSDSSSSSEDDDRRQERRRRKEQEGQTGGQQQKKKQKRPKQARKEQRYSKFAVGNDGFQTKGRVSKRDGRLNISINETANSGYIAKALGQTIKNHLDIPNRHGPKPEVAQGGPPPSQDTDVKNEQRAVSGGSVEVADAIHRTVERPRLNIVVMVIGSRGDIQPFMQIGKVLQRHGHRVRIATHPAFREFVENDIGLEFFSVGGDPSELMAFMVKNPGLIPNLETVRQGEIPRRRKAMAEMFEGFWRACINATDDEKDKTNAKMLGSRHPFIADAIIANPPSFCHVHIAERLGIPLHMMFTFPYSPTQAFPHPLANISPQKSNVDANYVNFMSYPLVEMMTWQGLGDLVNRFRVKTLGLEPVSSLWAPGALFRMKVPYTYMWSPELVPKPKDWGPEIDIGGFVFLDLASNFKPPKELQDFLDAGEPPVYIGFGSIVVDDPDKFTQLIFEAVKMAGVRALVSKGWGGIGEGDHPDNVFMLGNTPHDWLFPKVKAVVHHGGAGTTAIGLKCGKPTMIVPFFGDQPFWGAMVAENKAGAHEAIPYKKLTAERLAEGIKQCLTEEAQENVQRIADSIAKEGDGAENAVKSFHRSLPLAGRHNMRCSILEERVAVWQLKGSTLRLSALAAEILVEEKKIKWHDLRLIRHYEWNDFDGPGEPISGGGAAIFHTATGAAKGVGMVPMKMAKHIKKREEHERKKKEHEQRREERRNRKAMAAQQKADAKAEKTSKKTEGEPTNGPGAAPDTTHANDSSAPTGDARPSGPQHTDTSTTQGTTMSADPEEPLAKELAEDAGHGLAKTTAALLGGPLDLSLAIAQGFHNAPRLYGDATVRKPVRITGFHSGLLAARKEFAYGIYDGWTGLVTQPVGGWKDGVTVPGRFVGLGKGFGKGVGGFVLKDVSAIISPPAAVGQGVRKELVKRLGGPGTQHFIRRAQTIRGRRDLMLLKEEDEKAAKGERQDGDCNGDDKGDGFEAVKQRVDDSWQVMTEVWAMADKQRRTRALMGRLRLRKERKAWEDNGALENIEAAERAVQAKKEGKSLEGVFRHRKREMDHADLPRAGAMQQPVDYEEDRSVAPNGHRKSQPKIWGGGVEEEDAEEGRREGRNAAGGSDETVDKKEKEKDDGESSDDTYIGTPLEETRSKEDGYLAPEHGKVSMDGSKIDKALGTATPRAQFAGQGEVPV